MITYSSKLIEDQLKKIDNNIYLYTNYCDIMNDNSNLDATSYIMKIFSEVILNDVCKNKQYSIEPALQMKKYHKDSNTVLCIINNKTDIGKKLLKVLDNDKVYITFIFIYDDKDNSIKFERAALCLGTVGNHMLFI